MELQGKVVLGYLVPTRTADVVKGWAAAGKDGLFMDHSSMVGPWSSFLSHGLVMFQNYVNLLTHWFAWGFLQGKPKCKHPMLCTELQLKCNFTGTLTSGPEANSAPCLTQQEYYHWPQWGHSFVPCPYGSDGLKAVSRDASGFLHKPVSSSACKFSSP